MSLHSRHVPGVLTRGAQWVQSSLDPFVFNPASCLVTDPQKGISKIRKLGNEKISEISKIREIGEISEIS